MTHSINELVTQLRQANKAYNANLPIMTDSEYDQLWNELYQLEPTNPVLYHTTNDPNIPGDLQTHSRPIYGTNKAFCVEDLKPFLTRHRGKPLVIEPKYDGCAAVLERTESAYRLTLEGNGQYGQDVTRHFKQMSIGFKPLVFESVELIIPTTVWNPTWGKNPRNTVAGWLARQTLPEDKAVHVVSHNYGQLYHYLPSFDVDDELIMNKDNILFNLLLTLYTRWQKDYPIDGLMIKLTNHNSRLITNSNGTTYGWSIAWKPPIQTKWTTVENIEWNVSRLGRVVPTVLYDPIDLCGTINNRVTGNNATWLEEQKICLGSKILVGKAGEIIPKILQVSNMQRHTPVAQPTLCPFCNGYLTPSGRDLLCESSDCLPQQVSKIAYFYSDKGMDLKGIGEAMISDMLDNPTLQAGFSTRIWLLLEPTNHESAALLLVLGPKRYQTYLSQRTQLAGTKTPVHFITGLGLKGLAYKTTHALWTYMKTGKLKGNMSPEKLSNFAIALSIWYCASKTFNNFKFNLQVTIPTVTYCITGTLSSSRQEMISYLETKNWLFTNQVSKHVDVLIVGDSPGKTKTTKATELHIPMITEATLPATIKANEKGE